MKRILLLLAAVGVIGAIIGYTLWNKPHADMNKAKADVTIDATALFNEFTADEAAATANYLGKTLAVTGKIKESTSDGKVSFETGNPDGFGVRCELDPLTQHARSTFEPGESVTLKGECTGFSFDVQLVRCVEAK